MIGDHIYVINFDQINKDSVKDVGGKGASLGEMTNAGIPVPPGFVITTQVYRQFVDSSIPQDLQNEILETFDELGAERVAVRSSAVAEDSSDASWAGQLETYLNVGKTDLLNKIKDCWNSIKSERVLAYAGEKNVDKDQLAVAVVVQKMVDSEVSGVMFTVNPVSNNQDEIMIESCYGLGEMLVQGEVTPDNFIVEKSNFAVKKSCPNSQDKMLAFEDKETKTVDITEDKKGKLTLTESQIKELAEIGIKIENHYGKPQDIEWALGKGEFYILQSRPITTL